MNTKGGFLVRILIILLIAQIALTSGGYSIAAIAPLIKSELNLSEAQIGLFISFFYIGAALASLPSGAMVDIIGVEKILTLGQLFSGFSLILFSFFNNYIILLIFMLLAGLGYSTINPASTKAIMECFPVNRRAMAMGFKQTGVTIGGALTAGILPVFALTSGWRGAILMCGTFLLIVGVISFIFYSDKNTTYKKKLDKTNGFINVICNRKIIILSLLCLVMSASQISLITYMVSYFYEQLKMEIIHAGNLLVMAQVGGTIGRVAWGVISDVFLGGKKKMLMVLIAIIASAGTLLMSIAQGMPYIVLIILVTILGFAAIGWNTIFLVIIAQLAGEKSSGTATGLSLIFIFAGTILGAPFFGLLADLSGSYVLPYRVFAVMLGFIAICFTVFRIDERNLISECIDRTIDEKQSCRV